MLIPPNSCWMELEQSCCNLVVLPRFAFDTLPSSRLELPLARTDGAGYDKCPENQRKAFLFIYFYFWRTDLVFSFIHPFSSKVSPPLHAAPTLWPFRCEPQLGAECMAQPCASTDPSLPDQVGSWETSTFW